MEPRPIHSRSAKTPGKIVCWQARWYGPDGKQATENGFRTKTLARNYARDMESARDNDRYKHQRKRGPADAVPTVAEYVYREEEQRSRIMAAAGRMRPSSKAVLLRSIRNGIERSSLGPMPVDQVKRKHVKAWLEELAARGHVPRYTGNCRNILRRTFDAAVEDEDLPGVEFNPVIGRSIVAPPSGRGQHRKIQIPTIEQVYTLADRMPSHLRAAVFVQAGLGLRLGELCGLREQDVDFPRRVVHVTGQMRYAARRDDLLKSESSRRTIPMQRIVQLALAEHMRTWPRGVDGLIFTNFVGHSARASYAGCLRVAADALAAADPEFPRHLVPHHLRHFYGSVFLDQGGAPAVGARSLGHRNTKMLHGRYEHPMPDRDEQTRALLDAAWGGEDGALRAAVGTNVDSSWIPQTVRRR